MRILVITGAGVSAESGIPTFRGKEGYWRNLDPAKLATPKAFARDPELVWQWYCERRDRIRAAKPNAAHEAITRLSILTPKFLLVTQNVDDLHARAGMPKEKMVQIHGDIFVTRCSQCEEQNRQHERGLARCSACGALMRPGVVWFGEQLDPGGIETVEKFLASGPVDFTLVVGTTALFGYIIDWAMRGRANNSELIEVNPEETVLSSYATKTVREAAAIALPRIVKQVFASQL
jgi:NAD-dependent protein deacetylase/lipoamidase